MAVKRDVSWAAYNVFKSLNNQLKKIEYLKPTSEEAEAEPSTPNANAEDLF